MKDYLEETNVQLGASYNVAKQSTDIQDKGLEAAAKFMGAEVDEVGMALPTPPLPPIPPLYSLLTPSSIAMLIVYRPQ